MELIPAIYYQTIYLVFVVIISACVLANYKGFKLERFHLNRQRGSRTSNVYLLLAIAFGLFIGFRPESGVFVDMIGTARMWDYRIENSGWDSENFLYDQMPKYIDAVGGDTTMFFVLMSLFYFIGAGIACRRLYGNKAIVAYVVWLAAFSTFSYATNGVKAGSAATWYLIALSFWNNKKVAFSLLFITLGFHHSMLLPIAAFVLCLYIKNPKYYFYFWIVCLLLSFARVTSVMEWLGELLAGNGDEHGADYLLGGQDFVIKKGLRIDFILYSAIPVIIGYWLIFKKRLQSEKYFFIWNVYVFINAFWLLCMYSSFTNRVAYLSWLMYPLVLAYPFLNEDCKLNNQDGLFKTVACGHLAFTLFMSFVYYS